MNLLQARSELRQWQFLLWLSVPIILGFIVFQNSLTVFLLLLIGITGTIFWFTYGFCNPYFLVLGSLVASRLIYEATLVLGISLPGAIATQSALRLSALFSGGFTITLFIVVLLRGRFKLTGTDIWVFTFFLFYNFVALLVGVLHGNSTVYLLGDFYNTLQVGLIFYALVRLSERNPRLIVRIWFAYCIIAILVEARYLLEYVELIIQGNYHRVKGGNYLLGLLSFSLFLSSKSKLSRNIAIVGMASASIVVLLAAYRAKWFFLLFGAALIYLLAKRYRENSIKLLPVILIFVSMLCLIIGPNLREISAMIQKRLMQETIYIYRAENIDSSSYQKIYEARRVIEEFAKQPSMLLIGFGNGAQFDITSEAVIYIRERNRESMKLHNIHVTYFAILFRYGLIGLILFLAIYSSFLRLSWQNLHYFYRVRSPPQASYYNTQLEYLSIFCLVYLVLALLGFTQDYYLGVFMGYVEWGMIFSTIYIGNKFLKRGSIYESAEIGPRS